MTHARSPRALLAALAIGAFTLGALPLASPAATAKTAASAVKAATKTTAAKSAATKAVAKKTLSAKALAAKKAAAKRRTGYHPHNGPAPADEYFGRLQMSILGVRSKVRDLGLDADIHPEHDQRVLGNALWVEDAMRDWAKKYPFDRWLPRYAYALEQMYERIPGGDAHKRALKQISYLTAYFPQTVYGKIGRAKLAMGVPRARPVGHAADRNRSRTPRAARRQGHPDAAARADADPVAVADAERIAVARPRFGGNAGRAAVARRDRDAGARRVSAPLAQAVVEVARQPRFGDAAARFELALRRGDDAAPDALVERRVHLAVLDVEAVADPRHEPVQRASHRLLPFRARDSDGAGSAGSSSATRSRQPRTRPG